MQKFTVLTGVAAPMRTINVDTDMIIPKQYLKTIKRTGLGKGLFSEMRYNDDGSENPTSCSTSRPTATPRSWSPATISAAARRASTRPGRCSTSASAASSPPRFADIFYNNCFKNGILPIKVTPEELEKLFDDADRGSNATLTVDLEAQEIRGPDGGTIKFDIDAFRKHCLLNGLDDIGLTMGHLLHHGRRRRRQGLPDLRRDVRRHPPGRDAARRRRPAEARDEDRDRGDRRHAGDGRARRHLLLIVRLDPP
jgi:3-isopropylmalate/(R)-2-methylmalate dehydratase small subunit